MSTLVTGGTGFIGRYVVDRLLDGGESVVSYDRAPAGAGLPAGVDSVQGELLDLSRLAATIRERHVRGIVHAAGMSDPQLSISMPATTVAANATGTLHLLEASRLASFDGRIVLLSSTSVYGDNEEAIDERSPLRPRTPYAATKAFGDLLGQAYVHSYGLDVVSLRISQAYGPGRRLPGLLETIVDAALARRPLRLAASCRPALPPRPRRGRRARDRGCARRAVDPQPRLRRHRRARPARASRSRSCAIGCRMRTIEFEPGDLPGWDRQGPIALTAADASSATARAGASRAASTTSAPGARPRRPADGRACVHQSLRLSWLATDGRLLARDDS